MIRPITDAALSIVREMHSAGTPCMVLPPHVVAEMIARIDHQNNVLQAYDRLVDCHDNYLCEVDKTSTASERLRMLEKAREKVAELKG